MPRALRFSRPISECPQSSNGVRHRPPPWAPPIGGSCYHLLSSRDCIGSTFALLKRLVCPPLSPSLSTRHRLPTMPWRAWDCSLLPWPPGHPPPTVQTSRYRSRPLTLLWGREAVVVLLLLVAVATAERDERVIAPEIVLPWNLNTVPDSPQAKGAGAHALAAQVQSSCPLTLLRARGGGRGGGGAGSSGHGRKGRAIIAPEIVLLGNTMAVPDLPQANGTGAHALARGGSLASVCLSSVVDEEERWRRSSSTRP